MKSILLTLFFFFSIFSYTQKRLPLENLQDSNAASFYVRIPNSNHAPQILSKSTNNIVLKHKNLKIQNVFNTYKIYNFIRAFPTAKTQSLKETYLIKCNNIELMHELRNKFTNVYNHFEEIQDEPRLLTDFENLTIFTPNDYGFAVPQTDLDLINAQQAWDITMGNPNIKLGITDTEFNINHEELAGTISVTGTNNNPNFHGTAVAQNMAGNTNNGKGLASIGNNCFIEANTSYANMNTLLQMSQAGIKVINGSWTNASSFIQTHQDVVNEINDNGTTLVFAAGNTSNNTRKIYPAAYNHVISVTSIHHKNFMQPAYDENGVFLGNVLRKIDTHDNSWVSQQRADGSHNHTYAVDIAAPGYEVPTISIWYSSGYGGANGTSHAAPEVSGTIGLMLSVNDAIASNEIESILKLSSANIYDISENSNYIDKLGAGRLDAGKAVEMAYNMTQPQGIVEIENRDFYRDWSFELKNAPYQINIQNQIFRDTVKVDFIARNNIEIENTVIEPNNLGYTVLSIDPTIPLPLVPSTANSVAAKSKPNKPSFSQKSTYKLEYFLVNGNREDLVLINDNSSDEKLGIPYIELKMNSSNNQLELPIISGFCNTTEAIYKDKGSFLEVISRSRTTLTDCNNSQEYRFFKIATGSIYEQSAAKKVYYELSEDENDLLIWVEPNEKLFFTKTTFRTNENNLANLIKIFPNPASSYLQIESKGLEISKVTIIDLQGKEILVKVNNLDRINISNLSKGIYFIKLKISNKTITKKLILH